MRQRLRAVTARHAPAASASAQSTPDRSDAVAAAPGEQTPRKPDDPARAARRLAQEGDYDAALRIATDALETHQQQRFELERVRLECLVHLGLRAEAGAALATLQELHDQDPARATRLLVDPVLLGGDVVRSASRARMIRDDHGDRTIAAYAATLDLDDRGRGLVESMRHELARGDWTSSFEPNLEQIVAMVRRAGARPVLLGYPRRRQDVDAIREQVATATDTPLVTPAGRFELELQTRASEDLFIPDGHCTEAGYAILAQEAARHLLELERSRRHD